MDDCFEIVGVSLCAMISAPEYGVREIDTDLLIDITWLISRAFVMSLLATTRPGRGRVGTGRRRHGEVP